MLPFYPYPILLVTLNAIYLWLHLKDFFFFYLSPFAGFFLDKFLLQEFFWEIVTPPPVISNGPSLSTHKISFSWSFSSQNLKLSIVSVREDSLVSRVDGILNERPIQVTNIINAVSKISGFVWTDLFMIVETLTSNDATATRTSLKNCICVLSVFMAVIPTHLLCRMYKNHPQVEFQGTISKFRNRNKISSLLVYVLLKTRN